MRFLLASVALPLAIFGCGGAVALDDNSGERSPSPSPPPSSTPISLIAFDASPPPTACVACASDGDCASGGEACVKSTDGTGFCAPGCNKEGLCTPDRVCQWVIDPAGQSWRACVPFVRGLCATAGVTPVRLRGVYLGTW